MAGMAHPPRTHPREPLIWGIFLIGVGVAALAASVYPDLGTVILLVMGLGLLRCSRSPVSTAHWYRVAS